MASDIARWEPMRELGALRDEMERMVRQTLVLSEIRAGTPVERPVPARPLP